MRFFEKLKAQAKKDPKVVVLPESGLDKDGVIRDAIEMARRDGTAIPIGLTPELVEKTGRRNEFIRELAARKKYGAEGGGVPDEGKATRIAERVIKRMPPELFYSVMMVKLGYAHGVVGGRYLTSADVMLTAKLIVGEQQGKIVSSIFFREPPPEYPLFDLIACADMVVNQNPNADELYRIIVTSAETFQGLTGISPRIAVLSYITGEPQAVQINRDLELKKIHEAMETYRKGGHPWPIFQAQLDAAVIPSVAKKKGAPFADRPADILVCPSLMLANPIYKALDRLILKGNSMFITQGFTYPIMDLSRGDSAENIANVIAACSVRAQMLEQLNGRRTTRPDFLPYAAK